MASTRSSERTSTDKKDAPEVVTPPEVVNPASVLNVAEQAPAVEGEDVDPNPEDLTPTAAKKADAVVRYAGVLAMILGPHVRTITAEQWAAAGVENQDTTTWDEDNGYMIPAKKFSAHAIRFLTEVEQGFVLETLG